MLKIVHTIDQAIKYCQDNNMDINHEQLTETLKKKLVYKSKKYAITFLYDAANILA